MFWKYAANLQENTHAEGLCIKPGIQEGERNEGNTENRGILYFGECCQTFWEMSPSIPWNVLKHSGECPQTFWEMSPNISGNVAKHSGECRQIFRGMSSNIPGNVLRHSGESRQTFRGISSNISGNVAKHSREFSQTFWECSQTIQRIFENNLGQVVKHRVESMKAFGWMYVIVLDTGDHELYLFAEEPLLLNSRKRKRTSLSFLAKNKNILN